MRIRLLALAAVLATAPSASSQSAGSHTQTGFDEAEASVSLVRAMIFVENGDLFLAQPVIDKLAEDFPKTLPGRMAESIKRNKYEFPKKARVSIAETARAYAIARAIATPSPDATGVVDLSSGLGKLEAVQTKLLSYDVYMLLEGLKSFYVDLNRINVEWERVSNKDYREARNRENYLNSHVFRRNTETFGSASFKSANSLATMSDEKLDISGKLNLASVDIGAGYVSDKKSTFGKKESEERKAQASEKSVESDKADKYKEYEPPQELRDALARGARIMAAWADACAELGRVIDERFAQFTIEEARVQALIAREKWEECVPGLKKLVEKDPDSSTYKNLLGLAFLHSGKYEEAIVQANAARLLDTRSVRSYEIEGVALLRKGDLDGAATALLVAERNALGRNGLVPFYLACISLKQGDQVKANEFVELSLARNLQLAAVKTEDPKAVELVQINWTLKNELDAAAKEFSASQKRIMGELNVIVRKDDEFSRAKADSLMEESRGATLRLLGFVSKKLWPARKYAWAEEIFQGVKRMDAALAMVCEYNIACARALSGKTEEAIVSLGAAIDAGFTDVAHAKKDEDLKSLREHSSWNGLIARMDQRALDSKRKEQQHKADLEAAIRAAKRETLKRIGIANIRTGNSGDGKVGLWADVTNSSNATMKDIKVNFIYLDANGKKLFEEATSAQNVVPGEKRVVGVYLRDVAGYKQLSAAIVDLDY